MGDDELHPSGAELIAGASVDRPSLFKVVGTFEAGEQTLRDVGRSLAGSHDHFSHSFCTRGHNQTFVATNLA